MNRDHSGRPGPPELFAQAGEILKAAAGFTASCWETLDPVTLLPTSGVTENLPKASAPAYFENEYLPEDFNKFDELLAADVSARTLFDASGGEPARSRRYRELLLPAGLGPELRAVLTDGDDCWGAVALIRGIDDDEFPPEATALLARLAPPSRLGGAHRAAPARQERTWRRAGSGGRRRRRDGPVDDRGRDRWLDLLADDRHRAGRDRLPVSVEAVLARLGLGSEAAPPRARLQASDGTWLVVHGAILLAKAPISVPS